MYDLDADQACLAGVDVGGLAGVDVGGLAGVDVGGLAEEGAPPLPEAPNIALLASCCLPVLPGDIMRVSVPYGAVLPLDVQQACAWLSRAEGHRAVFSDVGPGPQFHTRVRILAPGVLDICDGSLRTDETLARDLRRLGAQLHGAVVVNTSTQTAVSLRTVAAPTY
jgi:hypothetical protein